MYAFFCRVCVRVIFGLEVPRALVLYHYSMLCLFIHGGYTAEPLGNHRRKVIFLGKERCVQGPSHLGEHPGCDFCADCIASNCAEGRPHAAPKEKGRTNRSSAAKHLGFIGNSDLLRGRY